MAYQLGPLGAVTATGSAAAFAYANVERLSLDSSNLNPPGQGSVSIWGLVEGSHSLAITNGGSVSGNFAFGQGFNNYPTGHYSHAQGWESLAAGYGAHAEGYNTFAEGDQAHAEGYQTVASGPYSHAEGSGSITIGTGSHAEGQATIASGSYQHTTGKYNQQGNTTSVFVVGIGSSNVNRKDGFTVDVDANGSGSVAIPFNTSKPSSSKTGSMYVDATANKLWIYTGNGGVSGWVTASLG